MIEVESLTRYYGSFPAVQDVSFAIREREIVGFLGLNGAGKSTTLRILASLLLPSAGSVRVGGIDALDARNSMRQRIGFLPEDPPLYPEMRVSEFLTWCGEIKGRSREQVRKDLPEALETCQITDVAHRVIGELSHGYRKRVGIAQAIIHRPDLVILDEPISGLDPMQIVEMRKVVRRLKDRSTVLVSSHILSEIAQTCDRILVIHQGRLVAEGTEQELGARIGAGTRLALIVRGAADHVRRILEASVHVAAFDLVRAEGDLVEVELTMAGDVREALARDLVEAGLGIRRLADSEAELEQIFLQLTRGAPAVGPAKEVRA